MFSLHFNNVEPRNLFIVCSFLSLLTTTFGQLPYVDVYNDFIAAHPYYANYRSLRPVSDQTTQMNVSVAVALNQLVKVDEAKQVSCVYRQ